MRACLVRNCPFQFFPGMTPGQRSRCSLTRLTRNRAEHLGRVELRRPRSCVRGPLSRSISSSSHLTSSPSRLSTLTTRASAARISVSASTSSRKFLAVASPRSAHSRKSASGRRRVGVRAGVGNHSGPAPMPRRPATRLQQIRACRQSSRVIFGVTPSAFMHRSSVNAFDGLLWFP